MRSCTLLTLRVTQTIPINEANRGEEIVATSRSVISAKKVEKKVIDGETGTRVTFMHEGKGYSEAAMEQQYEQESQQQQQHDEFGDVVRDGRDRSFDSYDIFMKTGATVSKRVVETGGASKGVAGASRVERERSERLWKQDGSKRAIREPVACSLSLFYLPSSPPPLSSHVCEPQLRNFTVDPGNKLSFSSAGKKYAGAAASSDDVDGDFVQCATDGVTFIIVEDEFTGKHFDAAMQTQVLPEPDSPEALPKNIRLNPTVTIDASIEEQMDGLDIDVTANNEEEAFLSGDVAPDRVEYSADFKGGREFVSEFSPGEGALGMELEEVVGLDGPYVVVNKIAEGGQASQDANIKVNSVVIGVEGFPIRTLENMEDVLTSMTSVNPDVCVRLHFVNTDEKEEEGGKGEGGGAEFPGEEEKKEAAEFFVTGGGQEVMEEEEMLASRVSAKTALESTIPPPPPLPELPLSLAQSVDDILPVTIYFQNKHSSYGMRVSWIDYDGDLVPRKELLPGESYMERSFSTHPWICTAVAWETTAVGGDMQAGMGDFAKNNAEVGNVAPKVCPSMIIRLGDGASSDLKSYSVMWDPEVRSMSFMPAAKISTGRVRPWLAPENAVSMNARIANARAMVIQQIRDSRMDPMDQDKGVGAGAPNLSFVLFGNAIDAPSIFDQGSLIE